MGQYGLEGQTDETFQYVTYKDNLYGFVSRSIIQEPYANTSQEHVIYYTWAWTLYFP